MITENKDIVLPAPLDFDWDIGNVTKNYFKHFVSANEVGFAFADPKKIVIIDTLHSGFEDRFILIGNTGIGRLLFIVFTLRGRKVRVISARDSNKKERKLYEKIP